MSILPGDYLAQQWGEKRWALSQESNPGFPPQIIHDNYETLDDLVARVRELAPSGVTGFWVQLKGGYPEKRDPFSNTWNQGT